MKKFLLLCVFFTAMLASTAMAQVSITIPDIVGSLDQVVTIPVTIGNVGAGPAIENYQIFPVSSTPNVVFVGGDNVNTLSGQFSLASCLSVFNSKPIDRCSGTGGSITTNGVLVNLQFKIIGPVTGATVSFNNFLFNGPSDPAISPLVPVINATVSSLPATSPDSYTVNEGNTLTVNAAAGVLANDVSGSAMTAALGTNVSNGTLTLSADGSFVYVHDGSETTSDSFTYFATNGTGTSSAVIVTITVTPVNDSPVAQNKTASTNTNAAVNVSLSGTDAEGSALTFAVVTAPANGSVTFSGSTATYTPNNGYAGSDSFTYVANDGTINSAPATVSLTVVALNAVPVATAASQTTPEDTPKTFTLVATDADLNPLTYSIVTPPTQGTVVLAGASATYTPNANYFGADSFTFRVNDGIVNSNTALISLTVTSVNDAPVASNLTESTNEDVSKAITLIATDIEGSVLTFSSSVALHGTVTVVGSTATYVPTANYFGADSFTFTASDGSAISNTGTVSITVTSVNDAPVAQNVTTTTNEDVSKAIVLVATDIDGDVLAYTSSQGLHGTVSVVGSTATYVPAANYFGADSFTYTVSDGTVTSNTATVTITISAVNDAPVASNLTINTAENVSIAFNLSATDVELDTITFAIVSQPTKGSAVLSGATVTYTPNPSYFGSDSFTYSASDGSATSNTATVTLAISGVNDAPIAQNVTATTNEDVQKAITLLATDADANALTYSIITQSTKGAVVLVGSTATYTPNLNYFGSDSFTYSANDGTVSSNIATVGITVVSQNDVPTVAAVSITTNEDAPVSIPLVGSDVEGDALTFAIVASPAHGLLVLSGSTVTYTPTANYVGTDSFTYTASDASSSSSPATVSITVVSVNDAPVVLPVAVSTTEDNLVELTFLGSDAEGSPLTFAVAGQPANGTVLVSGSKARYTPSLNFNGTDTFTYIANDGSLDSAPATVTVTVTPVNDKPVVTPQTVTTSNDAPITVELAATDVDGDNVTFSLGSAPIFGSVTLQGSSATYTAGPGFVGTDTFGIVANDGIVDSDPGLVVVSVTPAKIVSVQFSHGGGDGLPASLDVYYRGQKVKEGLNFRSGTAFMPLILGDTSIKIAASPSAAPADAFATFDVAFVEGQVLVMVFAGVGGATPDSKMIITPGAKTAASGSSVDAKFVHASASVPAINVIAIGTDTFHSDLFSFATNRTFESVGSVQSMSPAPHQFKVVTSGASGSTLDVFRLDFSSDAGSYVTVVASGQPGGVGSAAFTLFGVTATGSSKIPVVVTGTDEFQTTPQEFVLLGNYPNPFNPSTTIQFDLPESADVQIDVLDLLGRTMISIPSQSIEAGAKKSISVDASELSSGIYMYRVMVRTAKQAHFSTGTMTLIK